ncbi:MAG: hypothetical protein HYV27_15155 [Candidatus Hydrogenedentes bacterium]|nr:hypothetical protein [Candidatus Hydrogenedentota bacterium]
MVLRRLLRWLVSREVFFYGIGADGSRWRARVKRFTPQCIAMQLRRRFFLYGHQVRVDLDAWRGFGTVYVDDQVFGFVRRLN